MGAHRLVSSVTNPTGDLISRFRFSVFCKKINLSIKKGEFVIVLGPSGSGKSTLLNIIGGLDNPSKGEILINGENISNYSSSALTRFRRNNVGFIFQNYNLLQQLNSIENVQVGDYLSIQENPDIKIYNIFSILGMTKEAFKKPYQLSGGQQQRVSIARALLKNSKILLCDEPTGALDEANGKDILKLILKINKQFNTTVVMITHNHNFAKLADRTFYIKDGENAKIIINKNREKVENIK